MGSELSSSLLSAWEKENDPTPFQRRRKVPRMSLPKAIAVGTFIVGAIMYGSTHDNLGALIVGALAATTLGAILEVSFHRKEEPK